MKRILAAFAAAVALFSLSGCAPAARGELYEKATALDYYISIEQSFESGVLKCYKYSTMDYWSMINITLEEADFAKNSLGVDSMLYRRLNPVAFPYWPAWDYYDGEYYYYKYQREWFIDSYGRFHSRTELSHYGMDSEYFSSLALSENAVYNLGDGYRLAFAGLDAENNFVQVDMDITPKLVPERLVVRITPDGEDYTEYTDLRFSNVNDNDRRISAPDGLRLANINYLRKDFEDK